jgi:glutathione S-transferase
MLQRPPGTPRALGYGDFDTTMDVLAQALTPGPFLLGERLSTADVLIGSALRWGTMMGGVPERPEFAGYLAKLAERPALQRAMARDQELARR